eukprot:gene17497-19935_t
MTISSDNITLELGVFTTQPLTLTGADLAAANTLLQTGQSLMLDEAIRQSLTAHIVMLGAQADMDPKQAVQELLEVAANELAAAMPALLLAKPDTVQALEQLGADKTSALVVQWLGFAGHVIATMQAQQSDPALINAFQNAAPNDALLSTFSNDALWPVLPNTPVPFDPSMLKNITLPSLDDLIAMNTMAPTTDTTAIPTDASGKPLSPPPMVDPIVTLTDPGLVTDLSTQVTMDMNNLVNSPEMQAALKGAVDNAVTGNKLPLIAPTLVDPVLYAEVTTAAILDDPALLKVIETTLKNPLFATGVGNVGMPQLRNLLIKEMDIAATLTQTLATQGANAQLVQQIGTEMNSSAVQQIMVDSIPVAPPPGNVIAPPTGNVIAPPTGTPIAPPPVTPVIVNSGTPTGTTSGLNTAPTYAPTYAPTVTNTASNTTSAGSTAMNDTTNPVIAINASKNNLAMGETATLSFTLSQASTNFSAADVTAIGGSLSNFTGADSTAPSVMISNTKARVRPGETDLITFTLSEASSNFTQSDVTVKAGISINRRDIDYAFHGANANSLPWLVRKVASSASDSSTTSSGKYLTPLWPGHSFGAGWDGSFTRRSETRLQRDSTPQGAPFYALDQDYTADVKRVALYAQDEWDVTARLQAYLGLRWEGLDTGTVGRAMDKVQSRSSVWSPVLQMLWKLPQRERDQLRFALSRSYKAPLTRNLVPRRYTINNGNGPTNPDVEGNPKLQPELAWGVDAAYESYFDKGGVLSVSAYARRISGVTLQRLFQDGATWVSTFANGGRADSRGVEFDAKLPLAALLAGAPAIDLRANASRNWSRSNSVPGPHNRLAEQTPLTANLGLDYRVTAAWSAGFNFNYQGGGPARITPALSSDNGPARILDLYALWKTDNASQLRLSIANALRLDRRSGQYHADGFGSTARITAAPTSTGIRLQYETPL